MSMAWRSCIATSVALCLFLSSLLASGPAGAGVPYRYVEAAAEARIRKDPRYLKTLELCRSDMKSYTWITGESFWETYWMFMGDISRWSRYFQNRAIPPAIKALMETDEFLLALNHCGRADQTIATMWGADTLGKALGVAAWAATLRAVPHLLARYVFINQANTLSTQILLAVGWAVTINASDQLAKVAVGRDAMSAQMKRNVDVTIDNMAAQSAASDDAQRVALMRDLELTKTQLSDPNLPSYLRYALEGRAERLQAVLGLTRRE